MKRITVVALGVGFLFSGFAYAVDMDGIPTATTVEMSKDLLEDRITRVLEFNAALAPVNGRLHDRSTFGRMVDIGVSRMLLGLSITATNEAFLNTETIVFAPSGSSFDAIPFCARKGDYDFAAADLMRLLYTARTHPGYLWPETYERIVTELLPETGNKHWEYFSLGICGRHKDTENHILMIETTRYLTNQLLSELPGYAADPRYDNEQNGFNAWMLDYLQQFFLYHFEEYNSKPYQGYAVRAMANLHSYAWDPKVKQATGMLMDYMSAVMAVQSNGLRRHTPFRRQAGYSTKSISWQGDGEAPRFALLAGNYRYIENLDYRIPYGDPIMLAAAACEHRPEPMVLDLMIRKDHVPYYQTLHHDNLEIYSSSESFLISAGGHFDHHFKFGSKEQHGWARPTTLAPSREPSLDYNDLVRFVGDQWRMDRQNTCVARNFACGIDLRGPELISESCREVDGNWSFYDFSGAACALDYGFYLALYQEQCSSSSCRNKSGSDNYGFFEAREATETHFEDFVTDILDSNGGVHYASEGLSQYTRSDGTTVGFEINPPMWKSGIVHDDGVAVDRAFSNWPLAKGDAINEVAPGLLVIDNDYLDQRLILDMREPESPKRLMGVLARLVRSPNIGGNGGSAFDYSRAMLAEARIERILIRTGARVDALHTTYSSGLSFWHGGGGGSARQISLQPHEYIREVRLSRVKKRGSYLISSIQITTSAGQVLRGGKEKDVVSYTAPAGKQIIGFYGRSGKEIDRLGVLFAPLPD